MKKIKNLFALCLALAMMFAMVVTTGVFTVSAVPGAGLQQTTFRSYGADISFWNVYVSGKGNDYSRVDFAKMKADGCEFVILRIGYEASATRKDTIDSAFIEYYKRGREAGMPMGVYFYQLGDTYEEAVDDAKWVINVIEENNMYFEYPIYYDVEDTGNGDNPVALGSAKMEQLCLGWCETLAAAGYYPAIYGGGWSVLDKLSDDFKTKYDSWYAAYPSIENPHLVRDYSAKYNMWQYAASGYNYDGVPAGASLDVNVCYKDYPAIMKQYGYNNCGDPELEAARTELKNAMANVDKAIYKNYTDSAIAALRTAYNEASALIGNTNSKKEDIKAATTKLLNAYNNKGTNPAAIGVYINSVNTLVRNGQGVVFTSAFGEITPATAGVSWTANVKAKWDAASSAYLITDISYGSGEETPAITLASDEILVAIHAWEDDLPAGETPVAGSGDNYRAISLLSGGGFKLRLSGIDLTNKKSEVCAYIAFEKVVSNDNITYLKNYESEGIYAENDVVLYPDNDGKELTNGVNPPANAGYDDPSFVGFNSHTDAYASKGYASVTVDLGGAYKVDKFNVKVASKYNADSGIIAPAQIDYYVSYNGVDWYLAGFVTPVDTDAESVITAECVPTFDVYAKYIQFRFIAGASWIMVSEVEAFGTAVNDLPETPVPVKPDEGDDSNDNNDNSDDNNNDTSDDTSNDNNDDNNDNIGGDEEETDFMLGDINESGDIDSMDYVLLKRAYFGTYALSDIRVGDINESGNIDSMDYVYLRRAYFGTYVLG